jgi:hypothetical protein
MSGVFRNVDPPPPHPLLSVVRGGGHTRWVEREVGVNCSEDASASAWCGTPLDGFESRHLLKIRNWQYICKVVKNALYPVKIIRKSVQNLA